MVLNLQMLLFYSVSVGARGEAITSKYFLLRVERALVYIYILPLHVFIISVVELGSHFFSSQFIAAGLPLSLATYAASC